MIELVVTLAILGLLAGLAAPLMQLTQQRKKEQELRLALMEIRQAIDAYKAAVDDGKIAKKADESGYPPNLQVLYQGVADTTDLAGRKIFFLRRLPRDPFFPDMTAEAVATWGLRSYASNYDQPLPGKDVYDVYSMSPDTALNGTAYREW